MYFQWNTVVCKDRYMVYVNHSPESIKYPEFIGIFTKQPERIAYPLEYRFCVNSIVYP